MNFVDCDDTSNARRLLDLLVIHPELISLEKEAKVVREERVERPQPPKRRHNHVHRKLVFNSRSAVFIDS